MNGSAYNPNDKFEVIVYDEAGNILYSKADIAPPDYGQGVVVNKYPATYIIPSADWSAIVNKFMNNGIAMGSVQIAVKGYHTKKTPVSGGYTSALYLQPLSIVKKGSIITGYGVARYNEAIVMLNAGEYGEISLKIYDDNTYIIQTFGPNSPYMELYDSSGIRIASDAYSGYANNALFECYLTQGEYKIIVMHSSAGKMGEIKVGVIASAPIENTKTYEGLQDDNSFSNIDTRVQSKIAHIYRLMSTQNLTVSISVGSQNFPMGLYLIDPRSTVPISTDMNAPSVYNFSPSTSWLPSGSAKITKTLTAGVDYLLVFVAADINCNGNMQVLFDTQ